MIKQNLHTHSTYCDGKDTIEEMVLTAIDKGFTVLGFSGHGNCEDVAYYAMGDSNTAKYIQDVLAMKEKYQDQIKIFLGIEEDALGKRYQKHDPYDYIIGSVHYVKAGDDFLAVDENAEITQQIVDYFGSFLDYAKNYYSEVKKIADMDEVDIVGHVDLLTKFNEDETFIEFNQPDYLKIAYECIDALIAKDKIFEVNTGAIARGQRKTPYPHQTLLQYIHDHGGKICLNSDCHNKEMLDCYYQESFDLIKQCGFTSLMALTDQGFIEKDINEFNY